jgi:hypothetical protein
MTPSQLAWIGGGQQRPADKFAITPHSGICSTCGAIIDGDAVAIEEIDGKAFSNHFETFRFGSSHICLACAWMFSQGKGKPGNYIATPDRFEQAVISVESVVEDKRPWLEIIREIAAMPPDTPVTGVLTTDVKIRLWPRARLYSVGRFGLYVHCPDYDISQNVECDIHELLATIDLMLPILAAGFAKASLWYGLYRDYTRITKHLDKAPGWESRLREIRHTPVFLPALLMAGVTKEEKSAHVSTSPIREPEPAATRRDPVSEAQLGLF